MINRRFPLLVCAFLLSMTALTASAMATPIVPSGYSGTGYLVPAYGKGSVSGVLVHPAPPVGDGKSLSVVQASGRALQVEASGDPASTKYGIRDWVAAAVPTGTLYVPRSSVWKLPDFVGLKDLQVPIKGTMTPLGKSGLIYLKSDAARFDDPATAVFDGIDGVNRDFISCKKNPTTGKLIAPTWTLATQKFAADVVVSGVHNGDIATIQKGVTALNWGVARMGADGNFRLKSSCGTKLVEGNGGTHETSQYTEALGRAAITLAGSGYAGRFRPTIESYSKAVTKSSNYLTSKTIKVDAGGPCPTTVAVWDCWLSHWNTNAKLGYEYTHKRYIMSAALSYAALLTTDVKTSSTFTAYATLIALNGVNLQWTSAKQGPSFAGVNPEKDGYDIGYQTWGVDLALKTHASMDQTTAASSAIFAAALRGLVWELSRFNTVTGAVIYGNDTRTCKEKGYNNLPKVFEPNGVVHSLLYMGMKYKNADLIARAVQISDAQKRGLNKCPVV